MQSINFTTTTTPDLERLSTFINAHPHIHSIDMPYRLTATWQELGCKIGLWEEGSKLLAFALFQPPWWNLDYAIHPAVRGTSLEGQVLAWGRDQIIDYAQRTGESFWGSIEFFDDAPNASQNNKETRTHLEALGFTPFEWSTKRFAITLDQTLPQPQLPAGYTIRPLAGSSEVAAYVDLHRAAFGSDKMTVAWRERTLAHPAYRAEIDLVAVDAADQPVGFCLCWIGETGKENEKKIVGQIEPLGVHPDHQGTGLGRALELTALHTMRDHGAQTALVDHVSLNEAAIALSINTGFVQVNNALRYYIEVP